MDNPKRGRKRARDSDEENSDDSGAEPTAAKRQSHNVAEKRRRDKINLKLAELRAILPGSKPSQSKATTLNAAVELLEALELQHSKLWEEHMSLQTESRYLLTLSQQTNATNDASSAKDHAQPIHEAGGPHPAKAEFSKEEEPKSQGAGVPHQVGTHPTIPRLPLPSGAPPGPVAPFPPNLSLVITQPVPQLPPYAFPGNLAFMNPNVPEGLHKLPQPYLQIPQQPNLTPQQLSELQHLLWPSIIGQPQHQTYHSAPAQDGSYEEHSYQGTDSGADDDEPQRGRHRKLMIPQPSRSRSPSPRASMDAMPPGMSIYLGPQPTQPSHSASHSNPSPPTGSNNRPKELPDGARYLQVPSFPTAAASPPRSPTAYFPRSPQTGALLGFINNTPPLSPNAHGPPLSPSQSHYSEQYFDQMSSNNTTSPLNLSPNRTSPTPSIMAMGEAIFSDSSPSSATPSAFSRTRTSSGRLSPSLSSYTSTQVDEMQHR